MAGITKPEDFDKNDTYSLDVELWPTDTRTDSRARLTQFRNYIISQGGNVTDEYVSDVMILARIKASAGLVRELLKIDAIATIDSPPHVSLRVSQQLEVSLQDLPPVQQPAQNASGVCVVDSGIISTHPLLAPAVGEATVISGTIQSALDGHGHGTRVAGLALYGNVSDCIDQRSFIPKLRLFSARVLNDNNGFDDEKLITTQMRQAIEYFRNTYACRVFNLSLGDDRIPFGGQKVSPWASILDHLARTLDVVIVVSVGNYAHEPDPANAAITSDLRGYPRYLLQPPARIIEPSTGAIVLAVGSLAERATLSAGSRASLQPIAQPGQPSPFTRSGPGISNAIKPELCHYGGNYAADVQTSRRVTPTELSVVSLNREYLQKLFCTDNGTSFAAPRVAHIAAQLFAEYSTESANLIRALIAASAQVPGAARELLANIAGAETKLCGYGVPTLDRASKSDENRVLMYATGVLPFDKFHIYEIPIPPEFYQGKRERRISVTLAFDPPVRHTRLDYLGTSMSFRLIRGKVLDQVVRAFKKRKKTDPKESITDSCNCPMAPSPTERDGGTLQRATFSMKRGDPDYGETYFLVVRCERVWALDSHDNQRYAVVVNVESDELVNLYATIQARVQVRQRARARA
jgi:hypothetical protein